MRTLIGLGGILAGITVTLTTQHWWPRFLRWAFARGDQ